MRRLFRSCIFRYTLGVLAFVVLAEVVVFSFLYWATISLYEKRQNELIRSETLLLQSELVKLDVTRMIALITSRCTDEPGEADEYLLASRTYEYLAGNVLRWPEGVGATTAGLIDIDLGEAHGAAGRHHRVLAVTLTTGQHLLVGRNLAPLEQLHALIRQAMGRTLALTILLGGGGGFLLSRRVAARLDRINENSYAILAGDLSRRVPLTGSGDEFDDLTANLNHALDRIASLMRSIREVTDDIAHDMRKPISRLRSRIELTLMKQRDAGAYREALERTIEETDDILRLFNSLLTIATAESGTPRERFEEVDLESVARSAVELYEPLAEDAGLSIRLQIDEPLRLAGDPHLLTQALANLLDNAVKYAPTSGEVRVRVQRSGDRARLAVEDRGPGIPEDFRDRAVERFSRLEASRSTPGSGLGLSLVRAVARLHGGTVTLADNLPGLTVALELPLSAAERDAPAR